MAPKSRKGKGQRLPFDDEAIQKQLEKRELEDSTADDEPMCQSPKRSKSDEMEIDTPQPQLETEDPSPVALQRTGSETDHAKSAAHADRRIQGAAATIGGTAGMLLLGPVSGAALGAAALYASTREDSAGAVARKASSVYLKVSDRACDEGVRALDAGVKKAGEAMNEGCRRLSESSRLPASVRAGLQRVSAGSQASAPSGAGMAEAEKMRQRHPDRVPVFCERSAYSSLPQLRKNKFAAPGGMTCGEFKYMVHKMIAESTAQGASVDQTIYLFVNGVTPKISSTMSELYAQHRGDDGFVHVKYTAENTLGCALACQ
eukprot:gb/GFBE01047249.1/.p1 GENE.gb/GFBE01047249.1/~~gb/GFBE01047249.1/.p1  ORF type:complete len:317 (+),score=63.73 gb/GFBE01047249.1/:1-951(+)